MILPLRSKMRRQEDYMGCNGVLMTSMYLVLILYECLGNGFTQLFLIQFYPYENRFVIDINFDLISS